MTELMPGVERADLAPAADPYEGLRLAHEAARRLRAAFGERLVDVVLFGSWVRGDAHEESDVDLLVVLDEVRKRSVDRRRIVRALFDLEADNGRAFEGYPVGADDFRNADRPILRAARQQGVSVLEDLR